MWVKFTGEYYHRVRRGVVIHYKPGMNLSIPTAIANEAIKKGKAVKSYRPSQIEVKTDGEATERE